MTRCGPSAGGEPRGAGRIAAWVFLTVACGVTSGSVALAAQPLVAPGTVVRWPGRDLVECRLGERRWAPRGDACWYPIDLLQPRGSLTLVRETKKEPEQTEVEVSEYVYPVQHIQLDDDSRVHLSPENLARSRAEAKRIAALWDLDSPSRFELPLASPLDDLPAGGRFGARRFFNGEPRSPHSGADYAAAAGTSVFAVADGRVALAEDLFFSGESVFLDHGDGLISMYFHLSRRLAAVGEEVVRGQEIGRVGATGRASGPHLHFGVRWHGARIDPALLLGSAEEISTIPPRP